MPHLTIWETGQLQLLHPEFATRLLAAWDAAEAEGFRIAIRKFGGLRTPGIQAQLVQWRNESDARDGIIGGGRDYYRVAPAGSSPHEYGSATDFLIVSHRDMRGQAARSDASYRRLADVWQAGGLRAGYYFRSPKDEFHVEDTAPLTVVKARWRALVRERWELYGTMLDAASDRLSEPAGARAASA